MRNRLILISSLILSFLAGATLPLLIGRLAKPAPLEDLADPRLLFVNKVTGSVEQCYRDNTTDSQPPRTLAGTRSPELQAHQDFLSNGLTDSEARAITGALFELFTKQVEALRGYSTSLDWEEKSPLGTKKWSLSIHGKPSSVRIECQVIGTPDNFSVYLTIEERLL